MTTAPTRPNESAIARRIRELASLPFRGEERTKTETLIHVGSDRFEEEVVRSRNPVLVDFYADWCGPCRLIEPVIERLSQEYVGKVKFVKIDTDENQDLAVRFEVMGIPTVLLFNGGKIKERIVGAAPASVYKQKIESLFSAS